MTVHLTPPSSDVEIVQTTLHSWPGRCWLSVVLGDGGELVLDEAAARQLHEATSRLIQQSDRFEARIEDEAHNRNEWLKQAER